MEFCFPHTLDALSLDLSWEDGLRVEGLGKRASFEWDRLIKETNTSWRRRVVLLLHIIMGQAFYF